MNINYISQIIIFFNKYNIAKSFSNDELIAALKK